MKLRSLLWRDMASEKEIEPQIPVSDVVTPMAEVFHQEDTMVPTVEPVIPISEDSVGL